MLHLLGGWGPVGDSTSNDPALGSALATRTSSAEAMLNEDPRGFEWHYWNHLAHSYLLNLTGHTARINSVAFSPDGQRLASGSDDQTVKVWDAATGQELLTLKGHTNWVMSVVFSPDGKRLASASLDGTVKVWDARPWTPELRAEQQALSRLRFLAAKRPSQEQLQQLLRDDVTLTLAARRRALELAPHFK